MKITGFREYRITGRIPVGEDYQTEKGDRLGMPIDVYPEFKAIGADAGGEAPEDGYIRRSVGVL